MNIPILILALLGFIISLYGYIEQYRSTLNPTYKPACDINDRISCTKAFKSKYSTLFGVPNTVAGMAFYLFIAVCALLHYDTLLLYASLVGVLVTCYFAYLLIYKVQSYCLVCISTYIITITIGIVSITQL